MKKFLNRLRFFAVLTFVLWLSLEIFYRTVPGNYTVKHKNVMESKDTEILILGNSHTFYGLNPDYFTVPAFNLSNVSQTLMYDKLLLEKHIGHLKKLDYVILPIEYSSLSQADRVPELEWRKYFYEAQMDIETGLVSDFDLRRYSLALVPRFKMTINALGQYIKKGTLAECRADGWAELKGVGAENSPEMGNIIAGKHEDGSVDFKQNVSRIKAIIDKCRERSIKVILVTMPVTTHYADAVDKDKLQKIFNECEKLDNNYQHVQYLNLFQDKRFSNTDFYDVDHLNTTGAEKCSKIVNEHILSFQ